MSGNRVTAPLRPLGPAGIYTVSFHIVSQDGHPVSGSYPFTLTAAGSGTPAPESAAAVSTVAAAEPRTVPVWVWFGGAGLLLVIGALVAWRIAR